MTLDGVLTLHCGRKPLLLPCLQIVIRTCGAFTPGGTCVISSVGLSCRAFVWIASLTARRSATKRHRSLLLERKPKASMTLLIHGQSRASCWVACRQGYCPSSLQCTTLV